jgi:hypothetical protein
VGAEERQESEMRDGRCPLTGEAVAAC